MLDKPQASPWLGPLRSAASGPILLIARILMGYIFVLSGWGKLIGLAGFTARMQEQGIPYALAVVGPIVELFGGLALVLGVATPCAALALIAFTLVATGIGHRFWEYDGPPRVVQVISFEKNMAMVGGLLALFVAGPGSFSFDHLFARRGSS
jgi:putative oxidoreductase